MADLRSVAGSRVVVALVWLAVGCGEEAVGPLGFAPEAAPAGAVPVGLPLAPAGPPEVVVTAEPHPDNALRARVRVVASVPVRVAVEVVGGPVLAERVEAPGVAAEVGLTVHGLAPDTAYTLRVIATAEGRPPVERTAEVTTPPAPEGLFPEVEVVVDQLHAPGFLLFGASRPTPAGGRMVYFAIDRASGRYVWYHYDAASVPSSLGLIRPVGPDRMLILLASELQVIDADGTVHARFAHDPSLGGAFHHDGVLLPDGHLLVIGSEDRLVDVPALGGPVMVRGDLVHELDADGTLYGTLDVFDHVDPQRFPGPASRTVVAGAYNWTHGNALHYRAADDTYLLGLRNQSLVLLVERATGEVRWTFGEGGDFALEPGGEWFKNQHAPTWTDAGTLLLFDNGSEKARPETRAVEYALDEETRVARQVRAFPVPFFSALQGDVDDLGGGRWLVTATFQGAFGQRAVYELDADNTVRWELRPDATLYRTERVSAFPVP